MAWYIGKSKRNHQIKTEKRKALEEQEVQPSTSAAVMIEVTANTLEAIWLETVAPKKQWPKTLAERLVNREEILTQEEKQNIEK